MSEPIVILTNIAIIFLLGIIISIISKKLKISNVLLLLLTGIALRSIHYQGEPLITFPTLFLTSIGIMALALIVFDAASRFKFKEFDVVSFRALRLTFAYLILNMIFLSILTMWIFNVESVHLAVLFAALMAGSAPDVMLTMFHASKNRVMKLIEIESLLNTPFIVLIPFIILELLESSGTGITTTTVFISQLGPFLQQLIVGLGTGVLVGLIVFKVMRRWYSDQLSPLVVLTTAILTYVLAENLQGNGVLAVTVLGLFFGSLYVREKDHLQEFSGFFANALEILVFVLVGLLISFPLSLAFIIKSLLLFGSLIVLRYLAIELSFHSQAYSWKEKLFMSLNVQKGIAVAAITFTLGTLLLNQTPLVNLADLETILALILSFLLYSIILSTIVSRLSKYLLQEVEV